LNLEPTTTAYPLLGLDVSERRIGVAACDGAGAPPRALFTYQRTTRAKDLAQITEWVQRFGTGTLVLGLPLNMDGTEGPRAVWMRRFARHLEQAAGVPVHLQDERLTTVEASDTLAATGARGHEELDAVAAALILERYQASVNERA
jgi:putative holliday junction resolvase